jgi:hypothetical protein
MSMSDYEIRKLDQKYGEAEDRSALVPRCPTCNCLLIAGRGRGAEPAEIFQYPTCQNCGYEKK